QEIIWLGQGIEGDDTDGHIDDVARFVSDSTIVLSWEKNSKSPNHRILHENRERLQDVRTPDGSKMEIIEVPLPKIDEVPGWRLPVLPANYVNFLILNTAVIVPVFGHKKSDTLGCGIIGELFGDREIIPLQCLDIVHEGGALHCISQQQPSSFNHRSVEIDSA
ncbi:MAG: agmatine deiminase family protein, partial [Verrucomicrobiales bacterium]